MTGSEGKKATNSPRLTTGRAEIHQPGRAVRRRAQTPSGKQLGLGNHSQRRVVLQAACPTPDPFHPSEIFCPTSGRIQSQTRITKHTELPRW